MRQCSCTLDSSYCVEAEKILLRIYPPHPSWAQRTMTTHDDNNCASIRAIEEERSKQVRERSAILKEEARNPRDKRAERRRVEALITIVACAIGVSQETEEGKMLCSIAVLVGLPKTR